MKLYAAMMLGIAIGATAAMFLAARELEREGPPLVDPVAPPSFPSDTSGSPSSLGAFSPSGA